MPDVPKPPIHLVDCTTVDQVEAWLRKHANDWHYGAVMAGCGLCELAMAKLVALGPPKVVT